MPYYTMGHYDITGACRGGQGPICSRTAIQGGSAVCFTTPAWHHVAGGCHIGILHWRVSTLTQLHICTHIQFCSATKSGIRKYSAILGTCRGEVGRGQSLPCAHQKPTPLHLAKRWQQEDTGWLWVIGGLLVGRSPPLSTLMASTNIPNWATWEDCMAYMVTHSIPRSVAQIRCGGRPRRLHSTTRKPTGQNTMALATQWHRPTSKCTLYGIT